MLYKEFMLPVVLPCLRGDRIELRSMRRDDAAALFEIYGDPVVMRYTDEDPFPNLETVSLMLRSVQALLSEGASLEWGIAPAGDGSLVGTCGLHSFDQSLNKAEVGCLLRRSAWGNGYMNEAINLLIIYAKNTLGSSQLVANVAPGNQRAQRLFEHLGFRRSDQQWWIMDLANCTRTPRSARTR